jgi:hypothetical protein
MEQMNHSDMPAPPKAWRERSRRKAPTQSGLTDVTVTVFVRAFVSLQASNVFSALTL